MNDTANPLADVRSSSDAAGNSASDTELERAARAFAALGHGARLAIVRCLLRAHPLGRVAGEIRDELDIPASTLTHHLDALRHEGLISQTREGRFVRYMAGTDTLRALTEFLYEECCSVGGSPLVTSIGQGSSKTPA